MGIQRQHYVPQGFLKGFAALDEDSDKFLWVYEKRDGRLPRRRSVKSVAWESYYYSQETATGVTDTDSFEHNLAREVDNAAPTIIRSLAARPGAVVSLCEKDQGMLAFFIGLALTRVPSFREPIRHLHTRIAQRALDAVARRDPEIAERVQRYGVRAEAKTWVSLPPMVQVADVIAHAAMRKYWQFFVPPPAFCLVTSDNPVIFDVAREYGDIPAGPAHPLAELVVNLRKDLAMVCTPRRGGAQFQVFQMSEQEAEKFNRGIVRAARRFVFSPVRSEAIERLVQAHIGSEQTIQIG